MHTTGSGLPDAKPGRAQVNAHFHLACLGILVAPEQQAQQAKFVVEQKKQEAEQARQTAQGAADAAVIAAKGAAEARVVQAEAEAKSLQLIADVLKDNPSLLQYQYITNLAPNVQVMLVPSDAPFILPQLQVPSASPALPQ